MTTITQAQHESGWAIDDALTGLRQWGARERFALLGERYSATVGAAETCDIRVQDQTGSVSRQHATLSRDGATWIVRDLNSTNGTWLDGERRLSFTLTPGVEIEFGRVRFIAESERLRVLHDFLQRILGWQDFRLPEIDATLRGVRDAAARRAALVLCGAGNLTRVAQRLHNLAFGANTPFIVSDEPRRIEALLPRVDKGTLCVSTQSLPEDLSAVRSADVSARLIVCAATRVDAAKAMTRLERAAIVDIPLLVSRREERERLITEYAADAAQELGAAGINFSHHEFVWLDKLELATLEEIDELTLRVVAARNWGVTHGAAKLGLTHVGLGGWLRRRGIPT